MTMILKNVMAPLKMGSFLILALLAIFACLAIQILFPTNHGNRNTAHDGAIAQKCLNENGIYQQMMENNERIHLICLDKGTGMFYDVIFKYRNRVAEGITTYRVTEYFIKGESGKIAVPINTVEEYILLLQSQGKTIVPITEFGPFELAFP